MAEQLARTYPGQMPTDILQMRLPPVRRIMLNHAILRESETRRTAETEATKGGSTASPRSRILAKRRKAGF